MLETVERMCDVNTEGKLMSDRSTQKKKSRLTRSVVIKLPVNCRSYFWGKRKAFDQNMKKHNEDDFN